MRILFLGYNQNQTSIINQLKLNNCYLDHTDQPILNHVGKYDLIICYGYKHIISENLLKKIKCFILNLHISYLPYNKGAHPNFWSFYDDTPAGVTIHLVDKGVDTGPILYQKRVIFNDKEVTFEQTYDKLKKEIEKLFIENISEILLKKWKAKPKKGDGSRHLKEIYQKVWMG